MEDCATKLSEEVGGPSNMRIDGEVQQEDNACKPEWLEAFLSKTFFVSCTTHPWYEKGLTMFCTNCNIPVCKWCASSYTHDRHEILKLYKHAYNDAVTLATIEKHLDCSKIQPYKCNRKLVIALKPLPSIAKWDKAVSCDICDRKLVQPDLYRYCSISCKVEATSRNPNDSVPPFISIQSHPQENNEKMNEPCEQLNKEMEETTKPPKRKHKEKKDTNEPPKRKHKRKGIPHRAPFF